MRVLLADLNNFARYPTLAVGLLAAVCRQAGHEVRVFSPLAIGVAGVTREPREPWWGLLDRRLRYWSEHTSLASVRALRAYVAGRLGSQLVNHTAEVVAAFERELEMCRPDAVMISTYLMYYPACVEMVAACKRRGVPALIGGPYFSPPEVREEWLGIDGLSALVGGEVEQSLPAILDTMVTGGDLQRFPGVFVRSREGATLGTQAEPLADLDSLPFPDYSDFPWSEYPNRIVPIVTGRGCGWGACTFCSDVTSTAGRTFRSRSPDNVLAEVEHQTQLYRVSQIVFVDLKINSNLPMWHALLERMPRVAPNATWVGAVHVGARQPNGLTPQDLRAARRAGMVRLTTGLESGSQRVLDRLAKGTDLEVTSRFVRDAAQAGISVRTTMIIGSPGEDADDVLASAKFLDQHADAIDRVSLSTLALITGTRMHRAILDHPARFPGFVDLTVNHRTATITHRHEPADKKHYRQAVSHLLRAVHRINRKPLGDSAREFEGVM